MKYSFKQYLTIAALACLTACGSGDGVNEALLGEWTISVFEDLETGQIIELTDCDQKTKWLFTSEQDDPLSDGTQVMKLQAKAPEDCKFYGFDAKWTMKDGKLFISTTRIGGMGGASNAGLFEIVLQSPEKLVLKIMNRQYTFQK